VSTRAGLDTIAIGRFPSLAGDRILVVQPVASHFTGCDVTTVLYKENMKKLQKEEIKYPHLQLLTFQY
jgi:hypothetical protein